MLTLRLFGPPVVRDGDGSEVRLRSRKQLGVLVYLMVERERAVARDELMEAFWGDVSRERAYQSLCQALVEIRRRIGRDAVVSRDETIRIGVPTSTDVEALAEDLERRDLSNPLQEMDWWGTAELGPWLERSRAWCRRMAGAVLLRGIAENRLAGATLRVHRCAELLYVLDPLSEAAVLALTERELLKGDVVGGIRLLRAHLARIGETLGCSPQPSVERLLRRLEAGAHPPVELVPKRLAAHASRVRPTVLVARERELAALEGEWQRVQDERRLRSCIVTGAGGIGKSSLVRRFAATVAARAQPVFVVSCQEIGAGIPFATASDLVEELLRDPAVSATDPVWLAEVSRIHPSIRERYPGVPDPLDVPIDIVRLRIAEGIMRMIESITDGAPVSIVFDDLPYMDPATQDVIAVLTKRARSLPVLLIGTGRFEGRSLGAPRPLPDGRPLGRDATHVHLAPLHEEGIRSQVSALAPSLSLDGPHIVERIVKLSEGNPHFVEFLLSDWDRHRASSLAAGRPAHELPEDWIPPESRRDAFALFFQGLGDNARNTLQILAVAQRSLAVDEVARALGVQTNELDHPALELLTHGILRLEAGQLGFKSELHRAFAYFGMSPDARLYHHGILARSIRDSHDMSHFSQQLEAGQHYLLSGASQEARALIQEGARNAIRAGAPAEAERNLENLARVESEDRLASTALLLAEAQAAGGKSLECLTTLGGIPHSRLDPREALEAQLLRCRTTAVLRDVPAQEIMEGVEKLLNTSLAVGHLEVALSALQLLAEFAAEAGCTDHLPLLERTCGALLQSDNTGHAAQAALALGFVSLAQGDFEHAVTFFDSGRLLPGTAQVHLPIYLRLLSGLSLAQTSLGLYDEAEATLSLLEDAARLDSGRRNPILWSNAAVFHQERGQFQKAAEYFERALSALPNFPGPREHGIVYSSAASLAIDVGSLSLADECLRRAELAVAASKVARDRLDTVLVRADLHLARREHELAWKLMQEHVMPLGDRAYSMGESARHERLVRHLAFELGGLKAYRQFCHARTSSLHSMPLHGRVEIECFEEWVLAQASDGADLVEASGALEEAVRGGFAGVVLHLGAIGCLPTLSSQGAHDSATARRLVDHLPSVFPEEIPEALEWSLPSS